MTDEPEPAALSTQLAQLNERSRWYTSQVWQIPFAYLGITALAISAVAKEVPQALPIAFLAAGGFGWLVLWHVIGTERNLKRAVLNLKELEQQMKLRVTAEYTPERTNSPLIIAVAVASLGFWLTAACLFCRKLP